MTALCGQQSLNQSSPSDGLGVLRNRCATDVGDGSKRKILAVRIMSPQHFSKRMCLLRRSIRRCGPRADINRCTNRHRTAETFGQILSWLLETVRLRSAPELAVGARAEN